jgi:hypothetical protein
MAMNTCFYMVLKAGGHSGVKNHPVMERLLQFQQLTQQLQSVDAELVRNCCTVFTNELYCFIVLLLLHLYSACWCMQGLYEIACVHQHSLRLCSCSRPQL